MKEPCLSLIRQGCRLSLGLAIGAVNALGQKERGCVTGTEALTANGEVIFELTFHHRQRRLP